MIYITGDCHQQFERFNTRNFPEQREMTKENCVIICGDFGGVWNKDVESPTEKHLLDWLEEKPFTVHPLENSVQIIGQSARDNVLKRKKNKLEIQYKEGCEDG